MKHKYLFTKKMFATVIMGLAALVATSGLVQATQTFDTSPVRIAFNGNGDLLVSDYSYGQVLTLDPVSLDIIDELTVNGRPLGVAWANGLTYVGNSSSQQVEVYNAYGQEVYTLGFGTVTISAPQDIAIGNNEIYVVDGGAKVVQVFDQDGTSAGTIPQAGYDKNILANPTAITVDEVTGKIYVSDYGDLGAGDVAPRIQVFKADGTFAYTINSGSANKFRFTMPQGLTVNNNKLYAIDTNTSEIHVFDATNGTLLSKVKGSGITSGVNAMKLPLDLVIDNTTNKMFVTNSKMASISVF